MSLDEISSPVSLPVCIDVGTGKSHRARLRAQSLSACLDPRSGTPAAHLIRQTRMTGRLFVWSRQYTKTKPSREPLEVMYLEQYHSMYPYDVRKIIAKVDLCPSIRMIGSSSWTRSSPQIPASLAPFSMKSTPSEDTFQKTRTSAGPWSIVA